jgi:hypothetical protein
MNGETTMVHGSSSGHGGWRHRWFLPVAAMVVAGDLSAARWGGWSNARALEAGLLFDLAVLLPLLYLWCSGRQARGAVVRAVALACFGIWATGKIVPVEQQHLLGAVGWLRYLGLAGLVALEIKLGVAVYKAVVFSGKPRHEAEASLMSQGMPPWLARLMGLEAALWRQLLALARSWARYLLRKSK